MANKIKWPQTPLRYPGSKRKIVRFLDRILEHNNLHPKVIIEPFVGGGSVFLHFLSKDKKNKAIIGDKDALIYSFWKSVFNNPNKLVRFVKKVPLDISHFDHFRSIAKNPNDSNIDELAKACIFLNRTSFSGILNDSAGPIGGRKQKSKYRIGCRFNRNELSKQILFLSKFRNRVVVLPHDWERTIQYAEKKLLSNDVTLYYLDPPFFNKANYLYRHYFDENSHERLRNKLVSMKKSKWILSYDKANEIKKLYSAYKPIHIQMAYSVNSPAKRLEKEYVITPLKLPKLRSTTGRAV